jgi:hypothetical protein
MLQAVPDWKHREQDGEMVKKTARTTAIEKCVCGFSLSPQFLSANRSEPARRHCCHLATPPSKPVPLCLGLLQAASRTRNIDGK